MNAISSGLIREFENSYINTDNTDNNYIVKNKKYFKLLYVGTISYWFDFEKILKLLDDLPNITVTLVGPCEVDIPKHKRLIYNGIIPHSNLLSFVKDYDVLIMPFILNELILSVDPVKIYEYISFGKNIVSIYYKEMEKFRKFVYFYNDYKDLKNTIEFLTKNNYLKFSKREALQFLMKNTWEIRAKNIFQILEAYK
ncbi:MAG: teichuronic acid biosynthesis glycosyltransferase TuaH [Thermosipho sp. (in: thermotogales)]|nr:teichuronic acid biosynthesis glycosyltransferase TuaH [Thermosipho sp. (in: thermotogales)]